MQQWTQCEDATKDDTNDNNRNDLMSNGTTRNANHLSPNPRPNNIQRTTTSTTTSTSTITSISTTTLIPYENALVNHPLMSRTRQILLSYLLTEEIKMLI